MVLAMNYLILVEGQYDIFFIVQRFRLIFYTISWIYIIFGLKVWADFMNDLMLIVGPYDLYFMIL